MLNHITLLLPIPRVPTSKWITETFLLKHKLPDNSLCIDDHLVKSTSQLNTVIGSINNLISVTPLMQKLWNFQFSTKVSSVVYYLIIKIIFVIINVRVSITSNSNV